MNRKGFMLLLINVNLISMQLPEHELDSSALKVLALSRVAAYRGFITSARYSSKINRFDLDNPSWNTFLRRANNKNEYFPWYGHLIKHIDQDCSYKDDPDSVVQIDGPNYDGGPRQGILLEAHSYEREKVPVFDYCLYLLDNNAKEKRIDLIYQSKIENGEALDCSSIAPNRFFALATATNNQNAATHSLKIFGYAITSEQPLEITVFPMASYSNMPHFKKLCWIYGRNLLGLTHDKKLFIVGTNKGVAYRQWIPLEIDDIAVNVPSSCHEVFLLSQGKIYTANLARYTPAGSIPYRCIYPDAHTGLGDCMQGNMERIWCYDNEITVAQLPDVDVLEDPSRHCNFMYYYTEFPILEKILAFLKPDKKKTKSIRRNRFLRTNIEQLNPVLGHRIIDKLRTGSLH